MYILLMFSSLLSYNVSLCTLMRERLCYDSRQRLSAEERSNRGSCALCGVRIRSSRHRLQFVSNVFHTSPSRACENSLSSCVTGYCHTLARNWAALVLDKHSGLVCNESSDAGRPRHRVDSELRSSSRLEEGTKVNIELVISIMSLATEIFVS